MRKFVLIAFLYASTLTAQVKMELTPSGFAPVEFERPSLETTKLIELSQSWASNYNRRELDIYDITSSSLKIDAVRQNAFYYRNRGETYFYNIRYTLDIRFRETTGTVTFEVKEIFVKQTPVKKTIADFFSPDGRLKSDFLDVKPSLEETAQSIVSSYLAFISRQ